MDLQPIARPRVSDEVVRRLSDAIRTGVYAPGDYLPSERDLMKAFAVGRPAVREALLTLRRLGLVTVHSGTRSQVSKPDGKVVLSGLSEIMRHLLTEEDSIRQLQNLRVMFEAALVREAATYATAQDIRELKRALDLNREALGHGEKFIRADIGFHFALAKRTRNPMIVQIHDAMVEWLRDQRVVTLTIMGLDQISYREHEKIYEAVAARDPCKAEELMRHHLESVTRNYWQVRGNRR